MPFKVTLLLQDSTGITSTGTVLASQHIGGWSESYYSSVGSITQLRSRLITAGSWGIGLLPARAALLPSTGQIVGYRIATVFPRSGRTQTASAAWPGQFAANTDVPQMAVMCTAQSTTTSNIRRFALRGIPDFQVTYGEYTPSVTYQAAMTAFLNELSAWQFVGQDFAVTNFPIVNVTAGGVVTVAGSMTFAVGDAVQILSTVLDASGRKFTFKTKVTVGVTAGNQVTVANWPLLPSTGGIFRFLNYLLFNIDGANATADRAAVRKVGRPFGQYRGRRSKRKVL